MVQVFRDAVGAPVATSDAQTAGAPQKKHACLNHINSGCGGHQKKFAWGSLVAYEW